MQSVSCSAGRAPQRLYRPTVAAALLAPLCALFALTAAADEYRALADWAADNLVEVSPDGGDDAGLAAVADMIGDARIVSLGEGLHGAAEPLEFRNRLFRYLVEEKGFTAIVIESALVPGFLVNDYVHGAAGDVDDVIARGITFGLHRYPEQARLIEWMREYNAGSRNEKKLDFYGMDISSLTEDANGPGALGLALEYLAVVDAPAAVAFTERLAPYEDRLKVSRRPGGDHSFASLSQAGRDAVAGVLTDLVSVYETREGAYIEATSAAAYRRAYRAAIAAGQANDYMRRFPVGWDPAQGAASVVDTVAVADRAKADNIAWILEKHDRVLLFSHYGHAATTPVSVRLPGRGDMPLPPMFGTYLARHFGNELVTIGHLLAHDRTPCGESREPAAASTLEGTLAQLEPASFVLDLRGAPADVARSLEPVHDLYSQRPVHSLSVGRGTDVLYFTRVATPALACGE